MTQEQKELLMKDLCGRLPWGVKTSNGHGTLKLSPRTDVIYVVNNGHIPYLRPMSSMTEEEKKELGAISCECDSIHKWSVFYKSQDWLNKNMFDYRGLIEMGLALPATKDNV